MKKRGDDYKSIKDELGDILWEQALTYYPQLEDKRDYFDLGSPVGPSQTELFLNLRFS